MTLGCAAVGGWLFAQLRMPLAWMMGAMVVTTVMSLAGVRLTVPSWLRVVMTLVLGVMLGSSFTPELLAHIGRWPASLAALALYVAVTTLLCYAWFRRRYGWHPATAWYAAAPGGLNEMVLVGAAAGGDDRTIAMVHASRILFVVLVVPFWFRFTEDMGTRGVLPGIALDTLSANDLLVFAGCAVGGYAVALLLRLPASRLVGPMLASGAVHVAGIVDSAPPDVAVACAQLVLGASIGARFTGLPWQQVLGVMRASLGATALLLGCTALAALLLSPALGIGIAPLVLAFSPGGLAEMSLVALSLGVEVAFVATHHVARILLIVLGAPLLFAWTRRRARDGT